MNVMNYRGYAARIEYSDEDQLLVGHVAGIHDMIGFHGESISELRQAFEEAVDDYLETCQRLGREPQKPTPASSACAWSPRSTPAWRPRRSLRRKASTNG
jgi:predicted HicB family RNase H-like nuclease